MMGSIFFPHPFGLAERAVGTWNLKVQPLWSEVLVAGHVTQLLRLALQFVVVALLLLLVVGEVTAGKV